MQNDNIDNVEVILVSPALLLLSTAFSLVAVLVAYIWFAIAFAGLARKTGHPAWAGWVPIYNVIVFFKIAGMSPLIALVGLLGAAVVGPVTAFLSPPGGETSIGWLGLIGGFVAGLLLLLGWAMTIIAAHRINGGFGKGIGYTLLATFLFLIWLSILGFGAARWRGAPGTATTEVIPLESRVAGAAGSGGAAATLPSTWAGAAGAIPPPPPPPSSRAAAVSSAAPLAPAPPVPPPPPPAKAPSPTAVKPPTVLAVPPASVTGPPPLASSGSPLEKNGTEPSPWAPPPPPTVSSQAPATAPVSATDSAPFADAPAPLPASAHANVSPPSADPAPVAAVRSLAPEEPLFPPLAPDEIDDEPLAESTPPEADEVDEDADDRTVIAPRKIGYALVLADGQRIPVPGSPAILGRKPVATADLPDALLIAVPDSTKTMSKNHAIVELVGDSWHVTDLASTNGVATYTPDGTETVIPVGAATAIPGEFALGQVRMRMEKDV